MKQVDQLTIHQYGFPEILLMENAGERIFAKIIQDYSSQLKRGVVVLAGRGNNGGDGLVIARKLLQHQIPVRVFIFAEKQNQLSPSLLKNFQLFLSIGGKADFIASEKQWKKEYTEIFKTPFIIDSMLGIGIDSPVRGILKEVIGSLNENYSGIILSIDVPSGLSVGNAFYYPVLKAETTYTVENSKHHMCDYPGKDYTGKIEVVSIGFPKEAILEQKPDTFLVQDKDISFPKRKRDSHKGSYGKVLVLGGSNQYPGAPQIALSATLKTGAGLVYYSGEAKDLVAGRFPEVIQIAELDELPWFDSIVVGPGWQKGDPVLLKRLVDEYKGNLIIDADAINMIAENPSLLKSRKRTLMTPHLGEFSRLIKKDIRWIKENKREAILLFAGDYPDISVLLKDSVSLFYHNEKFYYLPWGTAALARGGSGDLLAGLIGGFSAYMTLDKAVYLANYLNGKTAELLSKKKGDTALSIMDFPKYYGEIIKEIEQ